MAGRRRLTRAQARRLALAAQGFGRARPRGRVDVRHFRRAVADMAVVQLDSVNVFQRSHRMPFFARLGAYDVTALDRWLWRSREMVEAWAHVASVVPMSAHPLLGWRRAGVAPWPSLRRVADERPGFVDAVLDHVRDHGPVSVSDLPMRGERRGPWWGDPPGRLALDWLWHTGVLAVHDRTTNFRILYDLAERVVPAEHRQQVVSRTDAQRELLLRAARALGVGTDKDVADVFRLKVTEARPLLAGLVADGLLDRVDVEGWSEPTYADPAATVPRAISARAVLTPFDPVVWFRPRALRLFDFHYRIELYTPAARRRFGYYVLPFLLGDELVGRVDLRHDRAANVLVVPGAFAEEGHDRRRVARALADELTLAARWVGADDVAVGERGDLAAPLAAALG